MVRDESGEGIQIGRQGTQLVRGGTSHNADAPINSGPNSVAFKDSLNGIVVSYWPPEAWRTSDGGVSWEPLPNFPDKNVVQVEYIPGTKGAYIAHSGWGFNLGLNIVKTCDDGDNWEAIAANHNVNTLEFLSPTVGFGGDLFSNPTDGGMFKWDSDWLMDCEILSSTAVTAMVPLNVFPNPAGEFLSIQLPEFAGEPLDLLIFDAQGKTIHRQTLMAGKPLDVKALQPGFYLLKATDGERVFTGKFIRQ